MEFFWFVHFRGMSFFTGGGDKFLWLVIYS